jgi:hypothetical protein
MKLTNNSATLADATKEVSNLSKMALATLILAKIFGILGIAFTFINHILGGTFLGLAIVLVGITVYLCIKDMYGKQPDKDKETIDRLIKKGKLKGLLKEAGYIDAAH